MKLLNKEELEKEPGMVMTVTDQNGNMDVSRRFIAFCFDEDGRVKSIGSRVCYMDVCNAAQAMVHMLDKF